MHSRLVIIMQNKCNIATFVPESYDASTFRLSNNKMNVRLSRSMIGSYSSRMRCLCVYVDLDVAPDGGDFSAPQLSWDLKLSHLSSQTPAIDFHSHIYLVFTSHHAQSSACHLLMSPIAALITQDFGAKGKVLLAKPSLYN